LQTAFTEYTHTHALGLAPDCSDR